MNSCLTHSWGLNSHVIFISSIPSFNTAALRIKFQTCELWEIHLNHRNDRGGMSHQWQKSICSIHTALKNVINLAKHQLDFSLYPKVNFRCSKDIKVKTNILNRKHKWLFSFGVGIIPFLETKSITIKKKIYHFCHLKLRIVFINRHLKNVKWQTESKYSPYMQPRINIKRH